MIVILLIDLSQIASHFLSHTPTFISEEKKSWIIVCCVENFIEITVCCFENFIEITVSCFENFIEITVCCFENFINKVYVMISHSTAKYTLLFSNKSTRCPTLHLTSTDITLFEKISSFWHFLLSLFTTNVYNGFCSAFPVISSHHHNSHYFVPYKDFSSKRHMALWINFQTKTYKSENKRKIFFSKSCLSTCLKVDKKHFVSFA